MNNTVNTKFRGVINGVELNDTELYTAVHDVVTEMESRFSKYLSAAMNTTCKITFNDADVVFEVLNELDRMERCANRILFSARSANYKSNVTRAATNICNDKKLRMDNYN